MFVVYPLIDKSTDPDHASVPPDFSPQFIFLPAFAVALVEPPRPPTRTATIVSEEPIPTVVELSQLYKSLG